MDKVMDRVVETQFKIYNAICYIVENTSLNSFKSAVDNYFYDFKFMFHS